VSVRVVASSPYQTRSLFTNGLQLAGRKLQPDLLARGDGGAGKSAQVEIERLHVDVEVVAPVEDLGDDCTDAIRRGFADRMTIFSGRMERKPFCQSGWTRGMRLPISVCTTPLLRQAGIRFVVPRNSATNLLAGRS